MAKKGWSGSPGHTMTRGGGPGPAGAGRTVVQGPGKGKTGMGVTPNAEGLNKRSGGGGKMETYRQGAGSSKKMPG